MRLENKIFKKESNWEQKSVNDTKKIRKEEKREINYSSNDIKEDLIQKLEEYKIRLLQENKEFDKTNKETNSLLSKINSKITELEEEQPTNKRSR